jgi:DNA-binding transcriptional MerR regulator
MSRLYSEEDIARLKLIKHLVEDLGLNHAGVHLAIDLFNRMVRMRRQLAELEGQSLRDALNESLDEVFTILAG